MSERESVVLERVGLGGRAGREARVGRGEREERGVPVYLEDEAGTAARGVMEGGRVEEGAREGAWVVGKGKGEGEEREEARDGREGREGERGGKEARAAGRGDPAGLGGRCR